MSLRTGLLALCVVLAAGCARTPGPEATAEAEGALPAIRSATPALPLVASPATPGRLARLADRGELVAYPGHAQREDGAYTWHRADVSEDHALQAMAGGHLRLTTPDGRLLDVRYDHHVEHPSGDWTWIGHLPGEPNAQTILTFGEHAVFGSIAQPGGKPALRLTMRDGVSWLVETDPAKVAGIVNAATRPTKPDYHIVRRADLPNARQPRALGAPIASAAEVTATAATAGTSTVDLLIGYTPGLVTAYGSSSAVMTRLNYLVDVANAALSNSQVAAHVRLVRAMQVTYTETNTNDLALEQLSGYHSDPDPTKSGPVTPNSAFTALRNARETYGADLVSLIRPFKDPEQDSCGLAWLLGGGLQGIQAGQGWDDLAYSVVGDGEDRNEQDGKTYFCRDESLAHEMGHNEGSAHDRKTAEGGDGVLNTDDYGAFQYSFGYKTSSTTGNFYTVMAYGDSGQTSYRVFSNPRITFCGGRACGTTTYEDNARSLGQTIPVVAGFRPTRVAMRGDAARNDVDGDGKSDMLLRYYKTATNNFSYWIMNGASRVRLGYDSLGASYHIVATGDFNGDGRVDIVWSADSTRSLMMWLGTGTGFTKVSAGSYGLGWSVAGAEDMDGDGKSDLLLRYYKTATNNFSYWIMNGASRARIGYDSMGASYRIVATGDFNGDGKGDVVWSADSNRSLIMWLGNGVAFNKTSAGVYGLGWSVAGAGDIDGDGKSDLLLRYYKTATNNFSYWIMNGASRARIGYDTMAGSYRLVSTGDFNADGRLDLVWTADSTRSLIMWLGTGTAFSKVAAGTYGLGWSIVP